MPTIYEYFGILFLFHSREHEPIHIHAKYGKYQTIFELVTNNGRVVDIKRRRKQNAPQLPPSQMKDAEEFVWARKEQIAKKWYEYRIMHKKIPIERVTYRVNYK